MSQLAANIVFHPAVNRSIKLWSTTVGRDKTYRTIQYFSRLLAYQLADKDADLAARFGALKSALGSGRKMMRLFKPLEHLQAALKAVATSNSSIEQFTTIGRQLGYFGYLALDMIVWLNSIKFIRLDKEEAKRVNKLSQRFWLTGIAMNIICGIVKTQRMAGELATVKALPASEKAPADKHVELRAIKKAQSAAKYQLVQDSLDIWLPLTNLEFAPLSDGALGLIGTITSLMALRLNWAKTA